MQSIAEFLDGLPSYDERNFSRFVSKSCEKFPAYITTQEIPPEQIIVNVSSNYSPLRSAIIQWNRKKRARHEIREGTGTTSIKRPIVDNMSPYAGIITSQCPNFFD